MTSAPPGGCPACDTPLDPVLARAGIGAHPGCAGIPVPGGPPRPLAAPGPAPGPCQFADCRAGPVLRWPHGDFDLRHARMMAPRRAWPGLGIPAAGAEAG